MGQEYPGSEPTVPSDPSTPQSSPQQPPQYPTQPQQYPPQPGYLPPGYPPVQGYGQYGQPPYPPQPGGYPQPIYVQPPQPPTNSAKPWIIGCSIAAGLVIIICGAIGIALYIGAQRAGSALQSVGVASEATSAAQDFCAAIQQQDYAGAYNMLSVAEQGRVGTESQFETRETALDTRGGVVDTCDLDSESGTLLATVSSDGKSATALMMVKRANDTTSHSGDITLVLENNTWKVDGADSPLNLFP